MLRELSVRNLGVIEELSLLLETGMIVVTGETGAGKTLILDAISLIIGGRADSGQVLPGAEYAEVEGRFIINGSLDSRKHDLPDLSELVGENFGIKALDADAKIGDSAGNADVDATDTSTEEIVVRRVVQREGRSRCYINGRMATLRSLAKLGGVLVELHKQNTHQALLEPRTQRAALDRFGGVDTEHLTSLKKDLRDTEKALDALGGDEHERFREIDLLRYQLTEIEQAAIEGPDEDEQLNHLESIMAEASDHHEAAQTAIQLLSADGYISNGLSEAIAALNDRVPFAAAVGRLIGAEAEISESVAEIRAAAEAIDDNPATLEAIRERRQQLSELRRKYGPSLDDVLRFSIEAAQRLEELENRDEQATVLDNRRAQTLNAIEDEQKLVSKARTEAAPRLSAELESHLQALALAEARIDISLEGNASEQVKFHLAANKGHKPLPLTRVASGGELSRVMLALRMAVGIGAPTLVFDEVDAGVGGVAAHAVGHALALLSDQVLVVTHLAQVAAHAQHHLLVEKTDSDTGRGSSSKVRTLTEEERVVEMSRMLSGSPYSGTANQHAEELLAAAATCSSSTHCKVTHRS